MYKVPNIINYNNYTASESVLFEFDDVNSTKIGSLSLLFYKIVKINKEDLQSYFSFMYNII